MDVPTLPDISRILSMSAITLPAPGSPRLPQLSLRLERELVALGRWRLAAEDMPWTWRERSLARRSTESEGRALSSASTEAESPPIMLLHSDYSDWKPRRRAAGRWESVELEPKPPLASQALPAVRWDIQRPPRRFRWDFETGEMVEETKAASSSPGRNRGMKVTAPKALERAVRFTRRPKRPVPPLRQRAKSPK